MFKKLVKCEFLGFFRDRDTSMSLETPACDSNQFDFSGKREQWTSDSSSRQKKSHACICSSILEMNVLFLSQPKRFVLATTPLAVPPTPSSSEASTNTPSPSTNPLATFAKTRRRPLLQRQRANPVWTTPTPTRTAPPKAQSPKATMSGRMFTTTCE